MLRRGNKNIKREQRHLDRDDVEHSQTCSNQNLRPVQCAYHSHPVSQGLSTLHLRQIPGCRLRYKLSWPALANQSRTNFPFRFTTRHRAFRCRQFAVILSPEADSELHLQPHSKAFASNVIPHSDSHFLPNTLSLTCCSSARLHCMTKLSVALRRQTVSNVKKEKKRKKEKKKKKKIKHRKLR